jgi:hypothetical protein
MLVGFAKLRHQRIELGANLSGLFTRANGLFAKPGGLLTRAICAFTKSDRVFTLLAGVLPRRHGALP